MLGFLPVPILLGLMIVVDSLVGPSVFYDPAWLIGIGNNIFIGAVSFAVSYVALRNYKANGRIQVLLLGCGVLIFGIGGIAASIVRDIPDAGANLNVTIYNTGALGGAAFHFAAALMLLAGTSPELGSKRRGWWLPLGYAGSVLFMTAVTAASLKGLMPVFFVQGAGPTLVRQWVLGTADLLFVFSFLVFMGTYLRNREGFLYWYASALALTAISLTSFLIEHAVGSPVGWVGRFSQYLGGVYFLAAFVTAARSAQSRGTSLDNVLTASLSGVEEKFRALAENTPDVICRYDSQVRYIYVNSAGLELLGKPARAVIGKAPEEIGLDEAVCRTWRARVLEVLRTGRPMEVEDDLPTGRGRRYQSSHCVPEFGPDGRVTNVLVFSRDVTERREAEQELRRHRERLEDLVRERTAELEAKNARLREEMAQRRQAEEEKRSLENQLVQSQKMEALGRFAGGIAHDLNNILYPIIIDTESLLRETARDASLHQTLTQILTAANRQRDLIKQILSFARRSDQRLVPMRVSPLVRETLDLLRSSLPSTIRITHRIDAPSDVILGDPTQVQQIIMNLCRNAADAIGARPGAIDIGLANTRFEPGPAHSDIKAGEYVALTMKDSGDGMAKDVMDRIFEPFFTTKSAGKGSGMGLAVVHGILKRHGGAVTVESEQGHGSRFTVYLPTTDAELQDQALPEETTLPAEGRRNVLLVDDEDLILTSLQNVLRRMGCRVVAVSDGLQAYETFLKAPDDFDLVITDLTMPQLTGIELAVRLMDIRPDIPIILCTGFNDVIDDEKAKSMGIRELLPKPASINELKAAIRRALPDRRP